MKLALVVAVVLAGAFLLGSPAEACPAMESSARRATSSAAESGSGLPWQAWIGAGAAAWLALFGAAYVWGMRRR